MTTPLSFEYIEDILLDRLGNSFSIGDKKKILRKFGHTTNADNGVKTTIANFQGTEINETYATGNTIDRVVCDTGDVGGVSIEGHCIDLATGALAFHKETVILNGNTPVALPFPLYRATRIYRADGDFFNPATPLTGNVYVYDSALAGGTSGGVPDDATATKCMILAGHQNSSKCATSLADTDAWIITHITAGIERWSGSNASGDVILEVRHQGGVYRELGGEVILSTGAMPFAEVNYETPLIIPPNSDVKLVVTANTNNTAAFGEMDGFLAKRTAFSGLE